jgi:integrase/recombinase XerD
LDLLIRRRYSENTIKVYCSLFKEFIRYYSDIKPQDITEDEIRKYQDYLVKKRKISTSTQNQAINAIKFYYEKVLGREKGDFYIERPIREQKLPEIISERELLKILRVTDNIKHKTIITLLYSSGIRRGELINLRIRDLDFDKKIIFVRGGKGKKDRTTILADNAILVLNKYLKIYKPNYWLIEGVNKKQYSPTSIGAILKKASIKSGLNKIVRPHMLRHSFASHLVMSNTNIRVVQQLLGHSSLDTTQIYANITPEFLKSEFDNSLPMR